jgi:hypothetical protein
VFFENLKADFRKFAVIMRAVDSTSGFCHEELSEQRRLFRKKLQKLFKSWSDVQAVTGIALLFAAILQNSGGDLPLYHTAIVLDLNAVVADGQAIMLFYAFKTDTARSPRTVEQPTNTESPAVIGMSIAAPTVGERLHNVNHGIWPRLVSSLLYLNLDFVFSFHALFRCRDSDECFLSSKPRTGNYGTWGIAGAILMLCVYVPSFVPQDFLSVFLESLGRFAKTNLAFLYPEPAASDVPCPKGSRIIAVLRNWMRLIPACIIWMIGKIFKWILKYEISFPIGTLVYFL